MTKLIGASENIYFWSFYFLNSYGTVKTGQKDVIYRRNKLMHCKNINQGTDNNFLRGCLIRNLRNFDID